MTQRACRCCICQKGPADRDGGVTVYRVNATGVPGIWACENHIKQTDAPPLDPEFKAVCDALSGKRVNAH